MITLIFTLKQDEDITQDKVLNFDDEDNWTFSIDLFNDGMSSFRISNFYRIIPEMSSLFIDYNYLMKNKNNIINVKAYVNNVLVFDSAELNLQFFDIRLKYRYNGNTTSSIGSPVDTGFSICILWNDPDIIITNIPRNLNNTYEEPEIEVGEE